MIDLQLFRFLYTADPDDPYHLTIEFNNSAVAVGFASGDTEGDAAAFEVIDKFNGNQLSYVNIRGDDKAMVWNSIVTKAHHLVLELHAEAVKQAARDKRWAELISKAVERFENVDQYLAKSSELVESRNVSDEDIRLIAQVVDSLTIVGDKLDLINDPD